MGQALCRCGGQVAPGAVEWQLCHWGYSGEIPDFNCCAVQIHIHACGQSLSDEPTSMPSFALMLPFRSLALLVVRSYRASPSRAGANGARRRRPKAGDCTAGLPHCAVLAALRAPSHLQPELLLSPSVSPDKELSRLRTRRIMSSSK